MRIRKHGDGWTYRAFYITPQPNEVFSTEAEAAAAYDAINATLAALMEELPSHGRYLELCAQRGVTPRETFGYGDHYASISAYETGANAVERMLHQRRAFALRNERAAQATPSSTDSLAAYEAAIREREEMDGPTGQGW